MPDSDALSVAALVGGMVIAIVYVAWFMRRSLERAYAPLCHRFGLAHATDHNGRPIPERIEGEWQGCHVEIDYDHGGRHRPNRLRFTLVPPAPLPVPGFIRVRRKRLVDRLAVAVGLARRLWKPGYRNAGRAYIEATDDRYAETVVGMLEFRQAVLPLVEYLNPVLSIEGDTIRLTLKGPFLFRNRKLQPGHVQQVLNRLLTISRLELPQPQAVDRPAIPGEVAGSAPATIRERLQHTAFGPVLRPLTLVASTLLFVGPLVLWWGTWYPPLTWDLHLYGFAAGGILTLIYAALVFPAVRGHSRSLSEFSTYFFFAAVGFPSLMAGVPVVYNGLADTGEPFYLEGRLTGRQEGRAKIEVRLDNGRIGTVRLEMSDAEYDRLRGKGKTRIRVMPGALGFPWVPAGQSLP